MEMTGFKSIGLLKNWRGDSEILARLVVTGLKLIGLLKKERGHLNFIVDGNGRTHTNGMI